MGLVKIVSCGSVDAGLDPTTGFALNRINLFSAHNNIIEGRSFVYENVFPTDLLIQLKFCENAEI